MTHAVSSNNTNALDGWRVEFDLDAQIVNLWNGVIVSHVGTHYVIQMTPTNAKIAPGAELRFGFLATGSGKTATNVKFFPGTTVSLMDETGV